MYAIPPLGYDTGAGTRESNPDGFLLECLGLLCLPFQQSRTKLWEPLSSRVQLGLEPKVTDDVLPGPPVTSTGLHLKFYWRGKPLLTLSKRCYTSGSAHCEARRSKQARAIEGGAGEG